MRPNLLNPLGPKLWLASRSPRRAELLALVGAHFETAPVDVDEHPLPAERPDADRKSTRLNSSHQPQSRMPSSA